MSYLEVNNLSFSFAKNLILSNITFQINQGESFCLIGPNGSGKTTLLRIISGYYPYNSGAISFHNKPLKHYSKKELARNFAFVEQEGVPPISFTVEEVVSMGRYPWLKSLAQETPKDRELVKRALNSFDIYDIRQKTVDTLSGGERQLVSLAKAMVQEPQVLVLDEPTTYLDIGHQSMIMQYIRKWQRDNNLTIIMVLHDLNLAAQFSDRLLLLNERKIEAIGRAEDVLQAKNIENVYKTKPILIRHPETRLPQILLSN